MRKHVVTNDDIPLALDCKADYKVVRGCTKGMKTRLEKAER